MEEPAASRCPSLWRSPPEERRSPPPLPILFFDPPVEIDPAAPEENHAALGFARLAPPSSTRRGSGAACGARATRGGARGGAARGGARRRSRPCSRPSATASSSALFCLGVMIAVSKRQASLSVVHIRYTQVTINSRANTLFHFFKNVDSDAPTQLG